MSYELSLCISKLAVFLTDGGLATAHFLGDAKLFTGEHGLATWFYLRGFFFLFFFLSFFFFFFGLYFLFKPPAAFLP